MSDQIERPLVGRVIAVPESREMKLFGEMLEQRGAEVLRCPLVAIHDSPDREAVEAWLRAFVGESWDDLILLTGEGLRRLEGFARRAGEDLHTDFLAALEQVRKITRGPKPANALRKLGLKTDLSAAVPTTAGIIETLETESLAGRTVGVQLYGTDPNRPVVEFLEGRGARVRTVAPYVYADDAERARVIELVSALIEGSVDAIAFTSSPQLARLLKVARRENREEALKDALNCTVVAAVGPVMAAALEQEGVAVTLMPESTWFMKPLVRQLVKRLAAP